METITIDKTNTYLGFRLANEIFAISVANVIEVVRDTGLTSVPKTTDYVAGIINFRGEILSVVSAWKKLNVPGEEQAKKRVIVVIELLEKGDKTSKVGIIADKVIGVLNIPGSQIQPVMEFGNYYNPEFLKGAFKYKNDIVTILDIGEIFSQEEVEVINNVNKTKNQKN